MQVGDRIPDFRAPASTGQTLEWKSFAGKVPVVLAFLPDLAGDGDVQELSEFNRLHREFGEHRVQVLAVVKATAGEVRRFAEDLELTIPILADPSARIITDFDALGDDNRARPLTVVVDRDGTVAAVFENALASGHAVTVLDAVRELKDSGRFAMSPATG